ncbi:MAG: hypothetical protein FWF51_06190 [Chitinivibrionia bacterium]|nr:hypothetical protein [Chitinivibrionia bacterium]
MNNKKKLLEGYQPIMPDYLKGKKIYPPKGGSGETVLWTRNADSLPHSFAVTDKK